MDWKEILRVSAVSGLISFLLWVLLGMFNMVGTGVDNLFLPFLFAFIAAGLVLNRKLKNEYWKFLLGMSLASVVVLVLLLIFFGLYLDFLFDLLPF